MAGVLESKGKTLITKQTLAPQRELHPDLVAEIDAIGDLTEAAFRLDTIDAPFEWIRPSWCGANCMEALALGIGFLIGGGACAAWC